MIFCCFSSQAQTRTMQSSAPLDAPTGMPGYWKYMDDVSDDFSDDQVDTNKWEPFNKNWPGRAPGWFNPCNVFMQDGNLQLICKREDPPSHLCEKNYEKFSTSFIRSKKQILYGYLEALVQPADSITSSAFWLVRNDRNDWNEIDVFEVSQAPGHENKYHMNAHLFRKDGKKLDKTLSHPQWHVLPHRTCEKPMTVGLDWTKDYISWLVDGRVVRTMQNKYWHKPMWIQFDCETMGNWFGLPDDNQLQEPVNFSISHLRVWQRT